MRYLIHRYPAEMIDVVRLAGGQRVVIRPVLPQDADLTSAFFSDLPAPARYDRFLSPMRVLPPDLLARFTHVDYDEHLALVAEVFAAGRETVIGEARYVRSADGLEAEFAVSIADTWQDNGIASLMLGKLACRAAGAGVVRLRGETLADNDKMLRLARKAGFTAVPSPDIRGLMLLEKRLAESPSGHPCVEAERPSRAAA
jgi:acetyltransferase